MHTVASQPTAAPAKDAGRRSTLPKGPRTRGAIIESAKELFSTNGYEATSLEDIAARLGMSRASALFHFQSKRALLMAIVEPLFLDLESLFKRFDAYRSPLSAQPRRQLLMAYCDVLITHRHATILVAQDLTSIIQLDWPKAGPEVATHLMALLAGPDADRYQKIRAKSATGAIMRNVCMPPFDADDFNAQTRSMIVNCALAVFAAKP